MYEIWKYEIDIDDVLGHNIELELPFNAEVLHVGHQPARPSGVIGVWVKFPLTRGLPQKRRFTIVGTGTGRLRPNENTCADIENQKYVGTVIDGPHVWHVFMDN